MVGSWAGVEGSCWLLGGLDGILLSPAAEPGANGPSLSPRLEKAVLHGVGPHMLEAMASVRPYRLWRL